MSITRIARRKFTVLLVAVGLAVVLAALAGGTAGAGRSDAPSRQEVDEAIKTGKAKRLPPSAADVGYSGHWAGCRFVMTKSSVANYRVDSAVVAIHEAPTPIDPVPPDTGCVPRSPTQEEIAAFQIALEALTASNRPAGYPDPPKRPVSPPGKP